MSLHNDEAQELLLRQMAQLGSLEKVTELIAAGVKVNAQGGKSLKTALHWAVKYEHIEVAKALLKAGADPTLKDSDQETALTLAIKTKQKAIEDLLRAHVLSQAKYSGYFENIVEPIVHSIKNGYQQKNVHNRVKRIMKYFRKRIHEESRDLIEQAKEMLSYLADVSVTSLMAQGSASNQTEKDIFNKISEKVICFDEPGQKLSAFVSSLDLLFYCDQFSNSFKSTEAQEKFFTFLVTEAVVECIRFQRFYPTCVEEALDFFQKEFLIHFPDKKQTEIRKEFRKRLLRLSRNAIAFSENALNYIKKDFGHILMEPDGFIDFIKKYFPGDKINKLVKLSTAFETSYKIRELDRGKLVKEAFLGDRVTYYEEAEKYFCDIKENLEQELKNNKEKISICAVFVFSRTISEEEAYEVMKKTNSDAVDQIAALRMENLPRTGAIKAYENSLLNIYISGSYVSKVYKQFFQDFCNPLEKDYQKLALRLRSELSVKAIPEVSSQYKTFHPDFESVKVRDKAMQKELEQKRRSESKQRREEEENKKALENILTEMENRQTVAKKSMLEKLLSKLDIKRDSKLIFQIKDILEGKISNLSKSEFLTLVSRLEVPGHDKIQASKDTVSGNRITLNVGEFYCFTTHFRHNHEDATLVDPANVLHLKKMFEAIGLGKNNFWGTVKAHCKEGVRMGRL